MTWCGLCNRSFGSQYALNQHIQDSPAHAPSYDCGPCNRSFSSQDALDKHLQNSSAHAPSYDCEPCNRSFSSKVALTQHLQNAAVHLLSPQSPLDKFFQSYPDFPYDPSLPPTDSYSSLQRLYGWRKNTDDSSRAWARFQVALDQEFSLWFGSEDDLAAWHALCRAVRIEPLPRTCQECEKAVRGIYVNIVDLIEWARGGEQHGEVRLFRSLKSLREYTKKSGKVFPQFDRGGGNVVLRHLLRFIFRPG
ncbi:hypothetical protein BJX76DRAFT_365640 [Aspergillus varians]